MTVFTRPSLSSFYRKSPPQLDTSHILDVHQNEINENEAQDGSEVEPIQPKHSKSLTVSFVVAVVVMVLLAGLMCILEVYRHNIHDLQLMRYQGYCHIPLRQREQLIEPNYRMLLPLDWHSIDAEALQFDPTEGDSSSEDSMFEEDKKLIEEFSISDTLEKIMVYNGPNGRPTSFIHDFVANMSGIVDNDRCFVMDLNSDQVLRPQTLILSIQANEPFDLSYFRNTMRAVLPPVMDMILPRFIAEKCAEKPTYQLSHDDSIIRKRSIEPTEPTKVEYKYFSGKQVQEIEIGNLNDLIAYEDANK